MCFSKHFQDFSAAPRGIPRTRCATHRTVEQVADDTKATEVGQRYARALFELAEEAGATAAVEADLVSLRKAWGESADLRRLLTSPTFTSDEKGLGLAAVAEKARLNAVTRKFIGLLSANRRTGALVEIIDAFRALSAIKRGVIAADVVTALPLTAAQSKGLAAALRQALGKDPEISTRVDPAILGGIKVRVGSRLFDASLKSKLDSLKFALKRA